MQLALVIIRFRWTLEIVLIPVDAREVLCELREASSCCTQGGSGPSLHPSRKEQAHKDNCACFLKRQASTFACRSAFFVTLLHSDLYIPASTSNTSVTSVILDLLACASAAVPRLLGKIPSKPAAEGQLREAPPQRVASEPSNLSPRSYFKKMVLEKYTSLASAFRHMDVDQSNSVKLSVSSSHIFRQGMRRTMREEPIDDF